jgi:hypothetical protein
MAGFFGTIWKGIKYFGERMAGIVNYILLTVVYITGVFLTWVLVKLLRKHFLELKVDKNSKTYWLPAETQDYTKKESYRSF